MWFQTYSLLVLPHPVAFGDNSTTSTIRIGTVTLFSTISRKKYKIILTNVLLIPEFLDLSKLPLFSMVFPASSSTCYVQKGRTPVLTH
ncbi:hypothetical protein PAXRUDRAFT_148773 [Paxillus rubicundulus Ve08.2h10]|uniref:Retrovirus-related Pol polyprotein from transposon TNT 1-94-like beta-barrel domain-containing protein n=1 Tax=Paxillus rubicundulus Ve08.2h10 TaxID=930991 RepID=A0A0D0D567_9AGAM|nr:hypothetical protein PAXRUDRAFT_148773 [Paxillus rubicundulus Ve08.2h10]